MDVSMPHVLDYTVEEMIGGDRDHLWHHIKPHKCFQHQEQMIIVAGKGLTVTDIHGKRTSTPPREACGASTSATAARASPMPWPPS